MSIPRNLNHSQLHSAQRRLFPTGGEPPQQKAKETKDRTGDLVTEFHQAAEQGDSNAQFQLGEMYEKGRKVRKNEAEAIKWYRRAAYQGHSIAESWLHGMNRRQQVERPGPLR